MKERYEPEPLWVQERRLRASMSAIQAVYNDAPHDRQRILADELERARIRLDAFYDTNKLALAREVMVQEEDK